MFSLLPQHLPERSAVLLSGHAASTSCNSLVLTVEAQKGERTGQGLEKLNSDRKMYDTLSVKVPYRKQREERTREKGRGK